jgi:phenylacetate-CoA ligase
MMKIRGNNLWPVTVDSVMFSEPDVAEYAGRVYVDPQGRTEVEIRYALKSGTTDQASTQALTARLTLAIKDRTNVAMKLQAVARDQLPVFEYKARRWTDERKAGYAAAHRTGG